MNKHYRHFAAQRVLNFRMDYGGETGGKQGGYHRRIRLTAFHAYRGVPGQWGFRLFSMTRND